MPNKSSQPQKTTDVDESNIKHAEMFGLTTNMYTKHDKILRGAHNVNKHLANARIATIEIKTRNI